MAKQKLEFEITGDSSGAEQAFQKTGAGTIALGNIMADLAKAGVQALITGVQMLGAELMKATQAAAESQRGQVALASAMSTAGTYSKAAFKDALNFASALQQQTAFEDDAIIAAQKSFSVYGFQGKQLQDLTKATLDLAAAKGMDLTSAAELVAKSVGTETNALKKMGVEMGDASDKAGRAEAAIKGISSLFGGRAAADAQTFSGQVEQMKNLLGDLYEEVGSVITNNKGLQVVFIELKKVLLDATTWVSNHKTELAELVKGGIIFVLNALSYLIEMVDFATKAWTFLGNAFTFIVQGIVGWGIILLTTLTTIADGWYMIIDIASKVVPGLGGVKSAMKGAIDAGKDMTKTLYDMSAAGDEQIAQSNKEQATRSAGIQKVKTYIDNLTGSVAQINVAYAENEEIVGAVVAGSAAIVSAQADKTTALIEMAQGYTEAELTAYDEQKFALENLLNQGKISYDEYYAYLEKNGKKFNDQEYLGMQERKRRAQEVAGIILSISTTQAQSVLANQKNIGSAMEDAAKQTASKLIDIEIDKATQSISIAAAEEIGKASLGGFLSFGLTLLAIPLIAAAAVAAKAIIHGLAGFAEGGIVGAGGDRIPLPGAGTAFGAGVPIMAHAGEVVGTPARLASAGIGGISVNFNNYGPIASSIDIETLGGALAEAIQNKLKGAL